MIVIVAGMYRSGSTFSFNIVRELLLVRGGATVFSSNSLDVAALYNAQSANVVLKSHAPDELCTALIRLGAIDCVCTYRKPEDAIASWMHAFGYGIEESLTSMLQWIKWHRSVSQYALNIRYEDLAKTPRDVIQEIQRRVLKGGELSEAQALSEKYDRRRLKTKYDELQQSDETINIGASYYDAATFFHRRHITYMRDRAAEEVMTKDTIYRIRHELQGFVDNAGNYIL